MFSATQEVWQRAKGEEFHIPEKAIRGAEEVRRRTEKRGSERELKTQGFLLLLVRHLLLLAWHLFLVAYCFLDTIEYHF